MAVDIAIRVKDILGETLDSTAADAVQLRSDQASLGLDLMTGHTVGLINPSSLPGVEGLKFF